MPITRKAPVPPSSAADIPLLEDVVIPGNDRPVAPALPPASPLPPPVSVSIPQDVLTDMLTERIAALTDRLLRDASVEIKATLVNTVWERLRDEIPAIVESALRENDRRR